MSNSSPDARQPAMTRSLLLGLLLASMVLTAFILFILFRDVFTPAQPTPEPQDGSLAVEPPRILDDFTFTSHTGEPFSLSDLRGKLVVLFFGYTRCPDVCPLTLDKFTRAKTALADDAQQVAFVFVSVDAEHDTPETIAAYLNRFDPEFIGLSGDAETLRQIGTQYGMYFEVYGDSAPDPDRPVDHTSASYLIDRQGRLRIVFSYDATEQVIVADIRQLLQEAV